MHGKKDKLLIAITYTVRAKRLSYTGDVCYFNLVIHMVVAKSLTLCLNSCIEGCLFLYFFKKVTLKTNHLFIYFKYECCVPHASPLDPLELGSSVRATYTLDTEPLL